ncbi:AAA family ATPase [Streptomyces sp. NPDC035033]|uniref:ATP-binding protein n=1 Tax=Streptomyces sp. NPDC035033 TaxID=3155368 RepID=UPI0033FBF309
MTELIGREFELAALRAALAVCRLVTVTGAAGVGKSRLALEAVACARGGPRQAAVRVRWHDGVPVGPWAPAARIARALDAATGATGGHGAPDLASAVRSLPGGGLLLVLDDVDPVLTECAGLVRSLLRDVPALRVLVTARRPLGLGGEHVLRLGPLASDAPPGGRSPAAELFHALAARQGRREEPDHGAVDRVCALVEGVPLALELAVAQLADVSVDGLADRLRGGQCWLSAPGTPLRRHRSVRASIGAVHALCDPAVRTVWRRLSVFAGAFTEQAAVFVCEGAGLSSADVPPALAELSAVGVLRALGETGPVPEPRYLMARAARDFGAERLAAAGESSAGRARHARHCRSTAVVAETLWNTGLQQQAVRLVRDALDGAGELAGFLGHAVRHPVHAETAVETVLHLWFWWAAQNRGAEGAARLLALLPLLPEDSPLTARGQWLAGWLAADADSATARHLLGLAWPAAVLAGDDALVGRIAHAHGTLAWKRHDPAAAAAYYRQAADTVPEHAPGGPGPMVSLAALAVVQAHTSPALAARTARRALAQPAGCHDTWATALAHYARALADHRAGRTGLARRRAQRALAHLGARLDAPQARTALRRLLHHIDHGRPDRATRPPGPPRALPAAAPAVLGTSRVR